jgi:lipocalin
MLINKYWYLFPFLIKSLIPIRTEKTLNVSSYLGLWNQVATSPSTRLFGTGINFKNVTAKYELLNDSNISVYNSGLNQKNNFTNIFGYSYIKGKNNCKRKLHFDGVPYDGNYWIVKLGPIINNQYQYAIISGALTNFFGSRFSLYVLARNRTDYFLKYEKEVQKWCLQNNFKFFWNKYVITN